MCIFLLYLAWRTIGYLIIVAYNDTMTNKHIGSTPIFKQINCTESDKLDLRQAEAVLRYKPDIILLEYPCNSEPPDTPLNHYEALKKPKELVAERTKAFSDEVLRKHPWAAADTQMWQNVAQLWSEGHQVLAYPTDAPSELTSEWWEVWNHMYPAATKNWVWWVPIYLRERLMANHIRYIMDRHADLPKPMVLVFLQRFHWIHVQFLLNDPDENEIWEYYFGRFNNEVDKASIARRIQALNPVFYKYWQQFSDFIT